MTTFTDSQVSYVLEIIHNLLFIGSIEPGDKVSTNTRRLCKPSWTERFIRTLSGETREMTYSFIRKYVFDGVSFLHENHEGILKSYHEDIRQALLASIHGIQNLSNTYETDIIFKIKLDSLVTHIQKTVDGAVPPVSV